MFGVKEKLTDEQWVFTGCLGNLVGGDNIAVLSYDCIKNTTLYCVEDTRSFHKLITVVCHQTC